MDTDKKTIRVEFDFQLCPSVSICVHLCHLVRQESFADLVSCKELAMGIARSP
jgi:hypothetical protein